MNKMTPLRQGLPHSITLLFNYPIRGIMLIFSRPVVDTDNNDEHYETLVQIQTKELWYSQKLLFYSNSIYCSGSMRRQRTTGSWNDGRQRWSKPQQQILHSTHDKDRIAENKKQQTFEGSTHYIRTIPQGSAIQRWNRYTRGHIKTIWGHKFDSYWDAMTNSKQES